MLVRPLVCWRGQCDYNTAPCPARMCDSVPSLHSAAPPAVRTVRRPCPGRRTVHIDSVDTCSDADGCIHVPRTTCDAPETVTRIAISPRAVTLVRNADPIAWRDIVGDVTLEFCANDWQLVSQLALELGTHPLSRCNVARAESSLREDFEASGRR